MAPEWGKKKNGLKAYRYELQQSVPFEREREREREREVYARQGGLSD